MEDSLREESSYNRCRFSDRADHPLHNKNRRETVSKRRFPRSSTAIYAAYTAAVLFALHLATCFVPAFLVTLPSLILLPVWFALVGRSLAGMAAPHDPVLPPATVHMQ